MSPHRKMCCRRGGGSSTNIGRTWESQLQIKQRNNLFYLLSCDVNKCTAHTYTHVYASTPSIARTHVSSRRPMCVCVLSKCLRQLVRLKLLQIVVDTLEAGHGWCHQCLQQLFQPFSVLLFCVFRYFCYFSRHCARFHMLFIYYCCLLCIIFIAP